MKHSPKQFILLTWLCHYVSVLGFELPLDFPDLEMDTDFARRLQEEGSSTKDNVFSHPKPLSLKQIGTIFASELDAEFGVEEASDDDEDYDEDGEESSEEIQEEEDEDESFESDDSEMEPTDGHRRLNEKKVDTLWRYEMAYRWWRARHFEKNWSRERERALEDESAATGTENNVTKDERDTEAEQVEETETEKESTVDTGGRTPWVICCMVAGKVGSECHEDIQNHFQDLTILPMYNRRDKTCYVGMMTSSMADTATAPLVVTPVTPRMKLMRGTVRSIMKLQRQDRDEDDEEEELTFHAMFCPGSGGGTKSSAQYLGNEKFNTLWSTNHHGRSLLFRDFLPWGHMPDLNEKLGTNRKKIEAERNHGRSRALHKLLYRTDLWKNAFQQGRSMMQNEGDGGKDKEENACFQTLRQYTTVAATTHGEALKITVSLPRSERITAECLLSMSAAITTWTDICSLAMASPMKPMNLQASSITQNMVKRSSTGKQYTVTDTERPFFEAGITGKGEVVGVSDTGLDTDNCYFWDKANEVKDNSFDPTRRKVVQYIAHADRKENNKGHGTHVASTIAGKRTVDGSYKEVDGYADGIAPDSKIAFYDIFKGDVFKGPDDMADIFKAGMNAGAKIHSFSWTSKSNMYGMEDWQFDATLNQHRDLVGVVAAGNYGHIPRWNQRKTVKSPGVAKNVITVGASQSKGYDLQPWMAGEQYVAHFSSNGPTSDGRRKPDVVAPGFFLLSAGAMSNKTGECDADGGIKYSAGTSMAAAVVSGTCALIRQYFLEGFFPTGFRNKANSLDPSGQLIKAVLVNGAQFLKAVQNPEGKKPDDIATLTEYDYRQGFGSISMIDSLPIGQHNSIRAFVLDEQWIKNGDVLSRTLKVNGPDTCAIVEMSATLCWSDPPPAVHSCTECVLDDLDLTVINLDTNEVHYPNGLNTFDTKNNVERVRFKTHVGKTFQLQVRASDLTTGGRNYSLIATATCLPMGR